MNQAGNGHDSRRSTERREGSDWPPSEWQLLSDVASESVEWLFPDRIPVGMLTLIEGRKGCGKSSFCAAVAAHLTGGPPLPGCQREKRGNTVLWLAGEESAAYAVRPRIDAAGGDPRAILMPPVDPTSGIRRRLSIPNELEHLSDEVFRHSVRLLVADPYISFVPSAACMRDEDGARMVLEPLAEWAARLRLTVLMTRHVRKGRGGDALDAGLGSVAVGNVARSILRLDQHPSVNGLHLLSRVRGNHGAPPITLKYRLVAEVNQLPRIVWEGESELDADDLAGDQEDAGERDARADAVALIRGALADGPRPCREVRSEALDAGVSERTLRRAKVDTGTLSRPKRVGLSTYWEWYLPMELDKPQPKASKKQPKPRPKRKPPQKG